MAEVAYASTRELPTSVLLLAFLLIVNSAVWFVVSSTFHTAAIAALTIADKGYEKLYQSVTEKVPASLVDMPEPSEISETLTEGKLAMGFFTLAVYVFAVLYALAGIGIYKLKKWSAILTCVLALLVIAVASLDIAAGIPIAVLNILLLALTPVSWRYLN